MSLYLCAPRGQNEAPRAPEARGCGHFWRADDAPQICPHCLNVETNIREIDADSAVDAMLTMAGIAYSPAHQGETVRDGSWKCDAWRCTFTLHGTPHVFSFYTGLGLRSRIEETAAGRAAALSLKGARRDCLAWEAARKAHCKPVAPRAASVLHSLLSDSEATSMSFSVWCEEYGYSDDSITALDTYRACCDIGKTMRRLFTPAQRRALAAILQDY